MSDRDNGAKGQNGDRAIAIFSVCEEPGEKPSSGSCDTVGRRLTSPVSRAVSNFAIDYCERHRHPVNAALHLAGVPLAMTGFFMLLSGRSATRGGAFVFLGYLLQYLGHRAQGNEVGEVTLIKSIYSKVKARLAR